MADGIKTVGSERKAIQAEIRFKKGQVCKEELTAFVFAFNQRITNKI